MLEKIFIFIFGLCVGSFLNVCIFRLPKEKSIIVPPSSCPKCNALIKWYDNIPVLSYIFLRGRCRNCKENISFRYLLVEIISGFFSLILYIKFGFSLELFVYIFLFSLLIVISFIDIEYYAIPIYLCVVGIAGGLAFHLWLSLKFLRAGVFDLNKMPISEAFKGLIFGLGFCYLFKIFGDVFVRVYLKLRGKKSIEGEKEAMGLGDVDFLGMVGVFLGIKGAVLVFFLAPFFAIVYSIYAIIFKKSHLVPYLPYLSLTTIVVFFWGNKIWHFIFMFALRAP